MKIATTCMGAVEDFDLRLEGEQLALYGHKKSLPKSQIGSFELMIELYNLCGKIKMHKRTSPWFTLFEHAELLDFLLSAKVGAMNIEQLHQLRKAEDWDRLLLKSFMGTRVFNLRNDSNQEGRQVLLPLLDFTNHHSLASGFKYVERQTASNSISGGKRFISIKNSQPEVKAGFNECFVSYRRLDSLDPLDSLLSYGFVDKSSKIFRSISLEIDLLPDLHLKIDGRAGVNHQKKEYNLTPGLRKFQSFIPAVISAEPGQIRISHILLPSAKVPFTLRFILPILVKNHSSGCNRKQILDASIKAETEIILKNQQFYNQLYEKVILAQTTTPNNSCLNMLKDLTEFQLCRMKKIITRQEV